MGPKPGGLTELGGGFRLRTDRAGGRGPGGATPGALTPSSGREGPQGPQRGSERCLTREGKRADIFGSGGVADAGRADLRLEPWSWRNGSEWLPVCGELRCCATSIEWDVFLDACRNLAPCRT